MRRAPECAMDIIFIAVLFVQKAQATKRPAMPGRIRPHGPLLYMKWTRDIIVVLCTVVHTWGTKP